MGCCRLAGCLSPPRPQLGNPNRSRASGDVPQRGLISKPGTFNRQVWNYLALTMRRQTLTGPGEREIIMQRTTGYRILCPNEHELHEFARWLGPRLGRTWQPRNGYVDDEYDKWLFEGDRFGKYQYGRPTGRKEMMWGEFVAGWHPANDMLNRGTSSPMITDGVREPEPGHRSRRQTTDEMLAIAVAASMST